jgi:hypothetical protein
MTLPLAPFGMGGCLAAASGQGAERRALPKNLVRPQNCVKSAVCDRADHPILTPVHHLP